MSFDIIDLPEEMREKIYNYCWVWELVNLACCSKTHYNSVLYILWDAIRIPWDSMESGSLIMCKPMEHLKFTKTLSFYSVDHESLTYTSEDEENKELLETNKLILNKCNPKRLERMHFNCPSKYIHMIKLPCQMFADNLREVTFRNLQSDRSIWKNISYLHFLQKLNIEDCVFKDNNIKHISKAKTLKELNLLWNVGIHEEGIEYISNLSELRKIALNGDDLRCMNTNAFKQLWKLENLTDLSLECSSINDEILCFLCSHLKHLERLSIAGCKQVTDTSIRNLCTKTSIIKSLNINHTNITDTALSEINNLRGLQKLYMRNTTTTNLGVSYLQNATSLMLLDLSYTLISDDVIRYLKSLTSLKVLSINATGVTSDAILRLCRLTTFKNLNVSGPESII